MSSCPDCPHAAGSFPNQGPGHWPLKGTHTAHSQAPAQTPGGCEGPGKGGDACVPLDCISVGCGDMAYNGHLGERGAAGKDRKKINNNKPKTNPLPFPSPRPRVFSGRCQTSAASDLALQCCRGRAHAWGSPLPSPLAVGGRACSASRLRMRLETPPPREQQTPAVPGGQCAGAGRPPPLQAWELG